MNPTQRTLNYLRGEGWYCAVVEKWMKFGAMEFGRRVDAFGFGDILACRLEGSGAPAVIALIQCTSRAGANARRRKLLGELTEADLSRMTDKERIEAVNVSKMVKVWKRCGGVVMLITWKKPTKKERRWTEKVEII